MCAIPRNPVWGSANRGEGYAQLLRDRYLPKQSPPTTNSSGLKVGSQMLTTHPVLKHRPLILACRLAIDVHIKLDIDFLEPHVLPYQVDFMLLLLPRIRMNPENTYSAPLALLRMIIAPSHHQRGIPVSHATTWLFYPFAAAGWDVAF